MDNRSITLPSEMWERVLEILDTEGHNHPDTPLLVKEMNNQLVYPHIAKHTYPKTNNRFLQNTE